MLRLNQRMAADALFESVAGGDQVTVGALVQRAVAESGVEAMPKFRVSTHHKLGWGFRMVSE